MKVNIYEAIEYDSIPWPKNGWSKMVKSYFSKEFSNDITAYIENVHTKIAFIVCDDIVLPISLADDSASSYVTSPYAQYISYALRELYVIKKPLKKVISKLLIKLFGLIFRIGKINKCIMINSWFLSTTFYPKKITKKQIERITRALIKKYPDHALVFRSLNYTQNNSLLKNLESKKYNKIISRLILQFDPFKKPTSKKAKLLREELTLLKKNEEKFFIIQKEDIFQLKKLYDQLYIKKYSPFNPQYSELFFNHLLRSKYFVLRKIVAGKNIAGFSAIYHFDNLMLTPLIGYNISSQEPLYRLLSISSINHSQKNKLIYNRSSGASIFKIKRGATRDLEYHAVYMKHLPFLQKIPWFILKKVTPYAEKLLYKHLS